MDISVLTISIGGFATLLGIFSTIINLIRNNRKDNESDKEWQVRTTVSLENLNKSISNVEMAQKINNEWKEKTNMQIAEVQNCIKNQADELREFKEEMKYQRDKLDEVYAEMQYIKVNRRKKVSDKENEQ